MISKKEVNYIADLSRIKITPKETEKFQKEFSDILSHFDLLKKAKTNEKTNLNSRKAELRPDEVDRFSGDLLKLASIREGRYIKVKKIL